ncbi:MAG: RNA-guided endonuclease IscB [Candidatus Hodarchaeales archaeon]|jgi:5-methylcytosine-specific restriction endonuclease McrA
MESKLSVKLKNVPMDTSLVCSSTNDGLNREKTLSDHRIVLADNSGEENLLHSNMERHLSRLDVKIFVLNMRGQPLMPTTPRKARILLKEKKAKVIRRTPFTIQLNYPTAEFKQRIALGVDAGYSKVGFSAITNLQELLAGELTLRKDVSKKLDDRRMYRRKRRSKLWYRKTRFNNRKASKPKGWLAPSIQHKLDSHFRLVKIIKSLLPITKVIVEVASFEIQKMENPDISGIEYQQGTLFGYTVRNYLLEKYRYQCAYCKKANIPLEIEHIIPKSRGGTNRVDNLTVACHCCNLKKGNKLASECSPRLRKQITVIKKRACKSFKAATFMNMVRWKMVEQLDCQYTYGDRTKYGRMKIGLSKSHVNDAFVIAGGNKQQLTKYFDAKQSRRNNRSIQTNRKGFKPSIRKQRYLYQPNDLIRHNNSLCRVKGVFNYGKWIRLVNSVGKTINSNIKDVELIKYGKGIQFIVNSSTT